MHHASPDTPRTLPEVMARSARLHADRPALGMAGGMPITYAQMAERVSAAAAFLMDHGVARGDRVAILAENTPAWGITYFAVTGLGAVAVPVMSEFSPVQVGHILEHSGSRAVLVSGRLREKLALAGGGAETLDIEEAAAAAFPPAPRHPGQPALQRPAAEDLAAIIYTSGTTGHSKGVMLSHRNIVSNALATLAVVSVRPEDRLLSILTLAHTYECTLGLVAALSTGASIFYLDRPPSATALIPALQKVRPTIVLSVPLVMEKIYRSRVRPELEKHALSRLPGVRGLITLLAGRKLRSTFGGRIRVFAIGGAALSPDVEDFLHAARFPYAIG
jgi:long-chain acyl-CoA synthetase